MQHQDEKTTGRACKCPACFVERYSVGPEYWQTWRNPVPLPGDTILAHVDMAKVEALWAELVGAVK
jgi:hypothetical protein